MNYASQPESPGDAAGFSWREALLSWLVVTALLVTARWEILQAPPYYDYAIGLWVEADYLAESNFDYWGLRYREASSMGPHAGRRSYLTTIMPGVAAALLKLAPNPRAAVTAYHLLTLACGGAALVTFASLCAPRTGRAAAWGLTAALATTPIFCVQLDMVGFEMPLIAAALATLAAAARGRWTTAAAGGCLAFLVKPTGLLITAAVAAYEALAWWVQGRRPTAETSAHATAAAPRLGHLAAISLVVLLELGIVRWGSSVGHQMRSGPPMFMMLFWTPDVLLLGLATVAAGLWQWRRGARQLRSSQPMHGAPRLSKLAAALAYLAQHRLAALAGLSGLLVLLGIKQVVFIPRYVALLVPLVYLLAARLLFPRGGAASLRAAAPGWAATVALIAVNLANWNGGLFPSLDWVNANLIKSNIVAREGSFLERSHEYLADQRDNLDAVAFLAQHCREDDIFAGVPFNIALALPGLGYLDGLPTPTRPGYSNRGFKYISPRWYEASETVERLPRRPVIVYTQNVFNHYLNLFRLDEPGPDDEILFERRGPGRLVIYRPAWVNHPPPDDELRAWYLERLVDERLPNDTRERLQPWLTEKPALN